MKLINYGVCQPWPKLGDSIVYHSAFIHYTNTKDGVKWLNVQDTKKIPHNWKWIKKAYNNYKMNVKILKGSRDMKIPGNFFQECLKDQVRIAPFVTGNLKGFMSKKYPNGYVTCQTQGLALANGKPAPHYKTISKIKHDLPVVDISIFKTLETLQDAIAGAQEHIGVDSGGAWMALACKTPCTVISTANQMDEVYRSMHFNALNLLEFNGATIK